MNSWAKLLLLTISVLSPSMFLGDLSAQPAQESSLRIDISGDNKPQDVSVAIQLVVAMTLLTLSPSIIMMMTCFTRIVIVLSFVRMAIGVQQAPSNQIVIGLALYELLYNVVSTWDKIYTDAVLPYMERRQLPAKL